MMKSKQVTRLVFRHWKIPKWLPRKRVYIQYTCIHVFIIHLVMYLCACKTYIAARLCKGDDGLPHSQRVETFLYFFFCSLTSWIYIQHRECVYASIHVLYRCLYIHTYIVSEVNVLGATLVLLLSSLDSTTKPRDPSINLLLKLCTTRYWI